MTRSIREFVQALRAAEVRISVAEAIEAHQVAEYVGFENRAVFRDALSLTLAKSVDEKQRYFECFDLFFGRNQFACDQLEITPTNTDAKNNPSTGNKLADMLLQNDREKLALSMEQAGREIGITNIRFPTQINFFARRLVDRMGLAELEQFISRINRKNMNADTKTSEALERERMRLIEEGRVFAQRQFEVFGRFAGKQLREEFLERTPLALVDRKDYERTNSLIKRMARKLASKYIARHKRARRGHLDIRRTLRKNMAYASIPFETIWKQKRTERPKIVAVVDVSRSVEASAQFLLMFLYSLHEVLSDLRSFAFSSHLIAVDEILDNHQLEEAIPKVMDKIGFMSTDYGQALIDLKSGFPKVIDKQTTVIILGDARSNFSNPRTDIMKWISQRCRRIIWLNPEPKSFWGTGDSEMHRYRPYCQVAKTCRNIKDLERVVDDILRHNT